MELYNQGICDKKLGRNSNNIILAAIRHKKMRENL